MRMQLLGGLSAKDFLSQIWQRQPLLIREAIPDFNGILQASELFALAARDDLEARIIRRRAGAWRLEHGPFSRSAFARLPKTGWTLLVRGVNRVLPAADRLLRRFDFIPHARLDDLMVSYAVPGGGVGPHFDSYDVFLLQGPGRRRWRVSSQRDRELDPTAPVRILRNFRPQQEWLLGPGDMLYLPPGCAHEGVAREPGFTCSIGFRALTRREIASEFLAYLQDRVERQGLDGMYADPGLRRPRHAAEIPAQMVRYAAAAAGRVTWGRRDVARFLGAYLTDPGVNARFSPPARPLGASAFALRCRARGVRLGLGTQMLFRGPDWFVNGRCVEADARLRLWLSRLADARALPPGRLPRPLFNLLHDWYLAGWIGIGDRHE